MAGYLPINPSLGAPVGSEQQAHAGPAYRFHHTRTGSGRNYHRGWNGDPEMRGGPGEQIGNFAVQNAGRFLYFNALTKRNHEDMEQVHEDLTHGPLVQTQARSLARAGAPDVGDRPVHGPAGDHATFGGIPQKYADRTDSFGHLPRPLGNQFPSQGEASSVSRGVGPKSGLGSSPFDPARRDAIGPDPSRSMPNLMTEDKATSSQPGRRAPAGMDPRKRGTWANYQ